MGDGQRLGHRVAAVRMNMDRMQHDMVRQVENTYQDGYAAGSIRNPDINNTLMATLERTEETMNVVVKQLLDGDSREMLEQRLADIQRVRETGELP